MEKLFDPLQGIENGEDQHHEYKRLIDSPESIAGEIVAFANSDGGVLYIGVEDNGQIIGVDDRVGSIEIGKDADLVIFSGHPFDFRSKVEKVLVDGQVVFEN